MPLPVSEETDAVLLTRASRGDRTAFGILVARHQNAVASVAYAVCGDFARSEDLAQEAFVAAWPKLGTVGEAAKLRAWLCGIVRHRALDAARGARRRTELGDAGTLEALPETPSPEPGPRELAVTREESALVWRAIGSLPELYREPLVLFYREQQSVAAVATALEISEDAAKQRLARGRELLRGEVERVIARTLGCTTPGVLLTTSVLAALPVVLVPLWVAPAAAATPSAGGVAGAGAAAKATGVLPVLGALGGPLLGGLGAWLGTKAALARARSEEERNFIRQTARRVWIVAGVFHAALVGLLAWRWMQPAQPATGYLAVLLGWIVAFAVSIGVVSFRGARRQAKLFPLTPGNSGAENATEYRSRWTFLGLPLVHVRFGASSATGFPPAVARGWIAIGDVARGGLLAVGGMAVGPLAIGGVAIGLVALGGGAVGLVALGGIAVGGWALGGAAIAWFTAAGGLAVAHDLAWGGGAFALHANDAFANAWAERYHALEVARWMGRLGPVAALFAVIPSWLSLRRARRQAASASRN